VSDSNGSVSPPAAAGPVSPGTMLAVMATAAVFFDLPLDQVRTPYARQLPDERADVELDASLARDGLKVPITVSARKTVLAGNRRVASARRLGWKSILAYVEDAVADEQQEIAWLLACDIQTNRHWLDTAFLLADYQKRHGVTWQHTASVFTLKGPTVSRYIAATRQPQPVLDAIRAGRLKLIQLQEIKDVEPEGRKLDLLKRVVEEGLQPRDIRKLVRGRAAPRPKPHRVVVGGVELLVPPAMPPADLVGVLRDTLFPAATKAAGLGLGVGELQKLIAGKQTP